MATWWAPSSSLCPPTAVALLSRSLVVCLQDSFAYAHAHAHACAGISGRRGHPGDRGRVTSVPTRRLHANRSHFGQADPPAAQVLCVCANMCICMNVCGEREGGRGRERARESWIQTPEHASSRRRARAMCGLFLCVTRHAHSSGWGPTTWIMFDPWAGLSCIAAVSKGWPAQEFSRSACASCRADPHAPPPAADT